MRSIIALLAATTVLAACSSQTTAPAASSSAAPVAAAKAPQCYNGDASKFVDVGTAASISGVNVTCEKTADGKGAQWMGKKH
jgi:FlaG/FlaF family flagellin (archaellin)